MEAIDTFHPIHRLTIEQFHRMIEAGVFGEGDRLELIDGEMRDMAPIGPPHVDTTDHLTMTFAPRLEGHAIVRVQGPLMLDDGTEVYPDLMVLRKRDSGYRKQNPTGDDALLVIEVADSSLAMDLGTKLAKYARAGIRRYWVFDLKNKILHDHRDPDRFGQCYRQLHQIEEGSVSIQIEGVEIQVDLATTLG